MSHSDLDALDNFLDKKEEVELNSTAPDTDVNNVEWDLEDMKKAYIDSAEQQWDKYAGG
jgi:hypothetical protein